MAFLTQDSLNVGTSIIQAGEKWSTEQEDRQGLVKYEEES